MSHTDASSCRTSAVRVQRRRTAGWRLPANTICVSRPSRFGNPFDWRVEEGVSDADARRIAVDRFAEAIARKDAQQDAPAGYLGGGVPSSAEIRAELRGRNLACWCPLDHVCHADLLLSIANQEP
ncbi:DUF4326 domain-containing protein [Nocardia sp. 004]|uniref:DUF4326 domain-containing protein n=1 Tax=Nocardia sp. 004 TaxID=3385978 RepID=UPI0039A0A41A